jgi:hypothetical protein
MIQDWYSKRSPALVRSNHHVTFIALSSSKMKPPHNNDLAFIQIKSLLNYDLRINFIDSFESPPPLISRTYHHIGNQRMFTHHLSLFHDDAPRDC